MKRIVFLLIIILFITRISALCGEGQIDINSASLEELDKLTGIGPAYAQRIIDTRPFDSVDGLIDVNGIGEVTLGKIKQQGLACVNEIDEQEAGEVEEDKKTESVDDDTTENKTVYAKIESSLNESSKEITLINLNNSTNSKDIKSENNKENLSKNTYAFYGIIAFCIVFGLVFLLKKRKKQNELQ